MDRSNQKGFSLIEIMVTVAIVGILAVIAIPEYSSFKRKAIQSNAKTILSGIYATQMTFITEWDYGTSNLKQMGYEQIGEAYYIAGWHKADYKARGVNVNVSTRPTSGIYNGPLVDSADIQKTNTLEMRFDFAPGVTSRISPQTGYPRVAKRGSCSCTPNTCNPTTDCNMNYSNCTVKQSPPNGATQCEYVPAGVNNSNMPPSFVIEAVGNIGGSTYDKWHIRESKRLVNSANGTN